MLETTSLTLLFSLLFVLLLCSAFFSSAETALMSLNPYRLKHLKQLGHPAATRASELLDRPDRLIGLILLGNNFVNIFASAIATVIGVKLWGENGIMIATFALTIVVLLFAEVTPKTLAALHPERVAFPASFVLKPLLFILSPLVWLINQITNRMLKWLGVSPQDSNSSAINSDELRMALTEAGTLIPKNHRQMLMSILDLEQITVDHVMVPRHEMEGLNINAPLAEINQQLSHCAFTRVPVYEDTMDHIIGIVHLRKAAHLMANNNLTEKTLRDIIRHNYFVPEGTPLNTQLINFQKHKRRTGLVVDEYGDILGMVTLEDIFREIVGEFTASTLDADREIHPQEDGSYLITGSATLREINRALNWQLPTEGPKTINGLILERLEDIPTPGVSLRIGNVVIEIVQTAENAIKTIRVRLI